MTTIIGCSLVWLAFVLIRFLFIYPRWLCSKLGRVFGNLLIHFQHILYYGTLVTGLILCFYSGIVIGLIALGWFLCAYSMSVAKFPMNSIPLLFNPIAVFVGLTSLILGLVLAFAMSMDYGLGSTTIVLSNFLSVRILMFIERHVMAIVFAFLGIFRPSSNDLSEE